MDTFASLMGGLQVALTPQVILFCFFGVLVGMVVGVLPGIGALATIAMLLPLTFYLDPTSAIVMLAGIYYGAQYGGSTASILLNVPGTATAAVTCLDGYPMAKKGRAGQALFITSICSFVGGMAGIVLLVLFTPVLARVAINFQSAEYFTIMLLALVGASSVSDGSMAKGILMVCVGLVLGLVGTDITSGMYRFTMGTMSLVDGLALVAVAMGLFGLSEIMMSIGRSEEEAMRPTSFKLRDILPNREETRSAINPTGRGSAVGAVMGILPGAGPSIATFIAYAIERRVAKDKSKFGKGAVEGLAAPEAANNAAVQTAFIPTLSLGIPGDAVMAMLLGALILHGITPGPQMIVERPDIFWGLIASFMVGNVMLLFLNIPLIGLWVRLLTIPYHLLYPAILLFIAIGVYSVNNSVFDVAVAIGFGIVGYFAIKLSYPIVPLLLGFILGPMVEENYRRTMLLSGGDLMVLLERPISAVFVVLTIGIIIAPLLKWGLFAVKNSLRKKDAFSSSASSKDER